MAGRMINGAAALAELIRPASDTDEIGVHRVLPVLPELSGLLPGRGLRRGSTVAVATGRAAPAGGGTSLLLALLSAASQSGSWCAVVGVPALGALAAAESGIALDRLALVPNPGPDWPTVVAALIDGVDLVVTAVPGPISSSIAGRLAARARQRGSVLMPFGSWAGADITLQVTQGRWEGLGQGHGRLRRRRVTVLARGRGAAARPRELTMWMPGVTIPPVPGPPRGATGPPDPAPVAAAPVVGAPVVGAPVAAVPFADGPVTAVPVAAAPVADGPVTAAPALPAAPLPAASARVSSAAPVACASVPVFLIGSSLSAPVLSAVSGADTLDRRAPRAVRCIFWRSDRTTFALLSACRRHLQGAHVVGAASAVGSARAQGIVVRLWDGVADKTDTKPPGCPTFDGSHPAKHWWPAFGRREILEVGPSRPMIGSRSWKPVPRRALRSRYQGSRADHGTGGIGFPETAFGKARKSRNRWVATTPQDRDWVREVSGVPTDGYDGQDRCELVAG
jgi:hypothetical protein